MLTNLTRDDLARMLEGVSVERVAKEAEVSAKTIYRLRHRKHSPTLDTVEKIVAAIRRIKAVEAA
jgi:DNA-binding phage protein